jgi:hypothetical protein
MTENSLGNITLFNDILRMKSKEETNIEMVIYEGNNRGPQTAFSS